MIEIITFHGWALNSNFWSPLENSFSKNIQWKHSNRGYDQEPVQHEFTESNYPKIIFAHSYGYHWIPESVLKEADHIFLFSGFKHLYPDDSVLSKITKRKLKMMLKRINAFSEETIQGFHKESSDCNISSSFNFKSMNITLLKSDLRDMLELDQKSVFYENLISFYSDSDQIVPLERSLELSEKGISIQNSDHLFPLTHLDNLIKSWKKHKIFLYEKLL